MRLFIPILSVTLCGVALAAAATAADDPPPKAYGDLVACRDVAEAGARLDCYDKATAEIERARSAKELVLMDKASIRKTKRSLFGFSLPNLPFFGDGDGEGKSKEAEELQTSFASLRSLGYGKWQFTVPEGGTGKRQKRSTPSPRSDRKLS
ncbi:MAG: hypothetical protein IPG54_13665 [Sphingomonadales bacterium]|nr:hypothetical protein [Sphingomonadales bacterium]